MINLLLEKKREEETKMYRDTSYTLTIPNSAQRT